MRRRITGRHLPSAIRCAGNMPSPGRTNKEASPARARGRDPCSKQALAHVSMGTDRWSYGGRRFLGCPCRGHSPLRGRKIVRVVQSPINDQATAQSREVSLACPQKGVSAYPVWIQAWHSDGVMFLSSLPFETIVETHFQYAARLTMILLLGAFSQATTASCMNTSRRMPSLSLGKSGANICGSKVSQSTLMRDCSTGQHGQ